MWCDGEQLRQIGREAAWIADDAREQADSLSRCLAVQWESPSAEALRVVVSGQIRSLRDRAEDLTGARRLLEVHARAVDDRLAALARLRTLV